MECPPRFRLTGREPSPQNERVGFVSAPEARGRYKIEGAVAASMRRVALALAAALTTCFASVIFASVIFASVMFASVMAAAPELRDAQGRKLVFSLPDTNGAPVDLQKFRGRVVLVNFFATWCEPCRDELPSLRRLVERSGDKGPVVLAISVAEPSQRVTRFLEKMPLNFPVLLDETRAVTKSWEVEMLPSTFVLDEQLRLRLIVKGDHNWDDVDAAALPERLTAPSREDN